MGRPWTGTPPQTPRPPPPPAKNNSTGTSFETCDSGREALQASPRRPPPPPAEEEQHSQLFVNIHHTGANSSSSSLTSSEAAQPPALRRAAQGRDPATSACPPPPRLLVAGSTEQQGRQVTTAQPQASPELQANVATTPACAAALEPPGHTHPLHPNPPQLLAMGWKKLLAQHPTPAPHQLLALGGQSYCCSSPEVRQPWSQQTHPLRPNRSPASCKGLEKP